MKVFLTSLLCLCFLYGSAQKVEGVITYNRKTDWISIASKLPHMSDEEIDRWKRTWGNNENKGTDYDLFLKDDKSLYTYKETDEVSDYSWSNTKLLLIRDYDNKKMKDLREEMAITYLIEEDLPRTKWKILNEIKEIEGYLCMKAETTDTIKSQVIHAWFTDAIPCYGGPEGFSGLPGMILELDINDGDAVITATKVNLESEVDKLPIPRKMKGKKTSAAELNDQIRKYIAESIEGQKNPFWRVRY